MRKLILMCLFAALLSSCSLFHIHRVEIVQGNVMTSTMVDKLHPGMSEAQVKSVMGAPILVNILHNGLTSYVYSSQLGSGARLEKRVVLTFSNGRLQNIQRSGI